MGTRNLPLLALSSFLVVAVCAHDPCAQGNHQSINEPHRSTLFQPEPMDRLLCDNGLPSGWYVFDNNDEMPTSCVTQFHCGTHYPLWMQGTNPSSADGVVQRKACSNIHGTSSSTCCDFSLDIQVKNCGTFYVYYLQTVPGCPMAYCAGNKKVCGVGGQIDVGGNCPDLYPKLTSMPVLQKPEVTPTKEVRFPCRIDYPIGQPDVGFIVTWTIDGHELLDPTTKNPVKMVLVGDARIAYLDAMKLKYNLGKELKCNVSTYHPSKGQSISSDTLSSNGYWCGIKVSQDIINVDEGGPEKTVKVESTIPIPCTSVFQDSCKLTVVLKGLKNPADASLSGCHLDLKLDNITGMYSTYLTVKATRDFVNDNDHTHQLGFQPLPAFPHAMWENYTIAPITIITTDREHGSCIPWGDPHFTGFDLKKSYDIYDIGDFTLYKSLNQKRPFEVQVRTWACGSLHPCICAVIAREGNDVVEVDNCEKRAGVVEAPSVSFPTGHPLEGTTVSRDNKTGKIFNINFPSGTRIQVKTGISTGPNRNEHIPYMDLDVQAPPDDYMAVEGLCGNWNGVEGDALRGGDGQLYTPTTVTNFSISWLLPTGTSMFYQLPKYEQHFAPKFEYCSCNQGPVQCTKAGNGALNPNKQSDGTSINNKNTPHKRSARSYSDHYPDRHLSFDPKKIAKRLKRNMDATFPTPSGITESRAKEYCRHSLMSASLYSKCQQSNILTDIIDGCVEDIKYSDSVDAFKLSAMNAYDSICYNELAQDPKNIHYVNGVPEVSSSVSGCPNQCSLNGNCVSGVCHCHHGYTSGDCSVQIGVAPEIYRLRGDGFCDIRTRPCRQANVIVDNIMESDTLSCRITPMNVSNGEPVESGPAVNIKGEFLSFLEVQCPIPESNVMKGPSAKGFKISITSDGQLYSREALFIVADGYCTKCTADGVCTHNPNTCVIDGMCYRNGDQNNEGQVCDPAVSTVNWTSIKTVQEIDQYTATYTGCRCPDNTNSFNCACCKNGGCQCGEIQPNQCTHCNCKKLCGSKPCLFPPLAP